MDQSDIIRLEWKLCIEEEEMPLPPKVSSWGLSFFGNGGNASEEEKKKVDESGGNFRNSLSRPCPSLRLETDKDVYRPGDLVVVTIEIHNHRCRATTTTTEISEIEAEADDDDDVDDACSLFVERLGFEIKGTEKLDTQWLVLHYTKTITRIEE